MSEFVIKWEEPIFCITVHPTEPIFVAGTVSGEIKLFSIHPNTSTQSIVYSPKHIYSCRSLSFSVNGKFLYSAFKNNIIKCYSYNSGDVISKTKTVFKSPVSVLCATISVLICGHDDGSLSVYNLATLTAMYQINGGEYSDYVTDITSSINNKGNILYTTGGGLVALLDVEKGKILGQEYEKAELNCVMYFDGENKCITGDTKGKLHFYKLSTSDIIKISSLKCCIDASIECIASISSELLCVGCSDGAVRIVNRDTVKLVGEVGRKKNYDIDILMASQITNKLLAVSGSIIIVYDIDAILEEVVKFQTTKRRNDSGVNQEEFNDSDKSNKKLKMGLEVSGDICTSTESSLATNDDSKSLVVEIYNNKIKKSKFKQSSNFSKFKSQRSKFFEDLI